MNNEGVVQSGDESLIGLARLMRRAVSGEDLGPLGTELIARAGEDPRMANANALMDLSTMLQLRGDRQLALDIQSQALAIQQLYSPPMGGAQPDRKAAAIRLLVIMGAGDLMSNSPIELLVENVNVALDILYVTRERALPEFVPEHDVLFIAIAESEENLALLGGMAKAMPSWPRPVLNDPARIAMLSRDNNAALLKTVVDLEMPTTVRLDRCGLEDLARGARSMRSLLDDGDFPVIVRPVDSHAGKGLEKLNDAAALGDYLVSQSNGAFYVSRFVDYRSADGQFRKYRIVLIDGRPFICHMGISDHWMIHYLNAGMAESAQKREEEAQFMADFDTAFAVRHADVFNEINARVGLDYLGMDCAETREGRLLIFEIDSCMIVHAVDSVELFPYKQPQMTRIFDAFFQMLLRAASVDVS
ncbi:MAG: RimK family alpha-L-glutamate ligase [Gallionella sp.]